MRGIGLERFPVTQVDELFVRWDLDGGGTIDMDELEQALKQLRAAFIRKHGVLRSRGARALLLAYSSSLRLSDGCDSSG